MAVDSGIFFEGERDRAAHALDRGPWLLAVPAAFVPLALFMHVSIEDTTDWKAPSRHR